jgi:hypothetical protein
MSASMYVIACIEEPRLIRKILTHVRGKDAQAGTAARGPPELLRGGYELV